MIVDSKAAAKGLVHYWSKCVGAGRVGEGLRAAWLEQLAMSAGQCGFEYVRMHGLFHDDMFVYRVRDGKEVFNWQYVDDVFDRMLDIGVRPFVELGFCPADLATQCGTVFWWKGNGSPPKDYAKWGELVERFARHCIERYGLDEVRQWYFEVWNEPNLSAFWNGTRSQYFELYKVSAQALRKVDSQLRVGGPATSNFVFDDRFDGEKETAGAGAEILQAPQLPVDGWKPVWAQQFLDFCWASKLPVDFVSLHPYPTDFAMDATGKWHGRSRQVGSTATDLAYLRKMVSASKYPNAQIHMTEWSSSPGCRDFTHDYPMAAAYVVRCNVEASGLVDSLSYWGFTDVFEELGAGDTVFHGGFGLINYQGIAKPAFHAYRFLHALGDQELAREDGMLVTRSTCSGKLSAVAYNYPAEYSDAPRSTGSHEAADAILHQGKEITLELKLSNLAAGAAFAIETVDEDHAFAVRDWQAMGCPEPPNRAQTQLLRQASMETDKRVVRANDDGELDLSLQMKPWAVALVQEL